MDKHFIITKLHGIKLEENTSFQFNDWIITNNPQEKILSIPDMQALYDNVGRYGVDYLDGTVAYKFKDFTSDESQMNDVLASEATTLLAMLTLLWLENDNAIFCINSYLQKVANSKVVQNRREHFISNSIGRYSDIFIDTPLIEKIKGSNLLNKYTCLLAYDNDTTGTSPESTSDGYMFKPDMDNQYSNFDRLQRAWTLLHHARITNFLPMKIGFYINTLECIVLKSETELNFRLQLHTAQFIGTDKEDKDEIMNTIKRCYGVRSKFFHGEGIPKIKTEALQELSQKLDEIVRRTFKRAILHKDEINDNKKIDDFFKSLLF